MRTLGAGKFGLEGFILLLLSGCHTRGPQHARPVRPPSPYWRGPSSSYQGYSPGAPQVPAQQPPTPVFVRVELTGVIAGPAKTDRTQWDGLGRVSEEELQTVAAGLGLASPQAAAAAVVAALANKAWAKPDIVGSAELLRASGQGTPMPLMLWQDSFTPTWAGVAWSHVPLDQSVRLRVRLGDRDLVNDDPMGVFEVNSDDMRAALADGHVYPVRVNNQTSNQILFAQISVMKE